MLKLERKLKEKSAVIGIVGLGYVGLPLAVAFSQAGFKVVGFDIQEKRVDLVNKGQSYVADIDSESLSAAVANNLLEATLDQSRLKEVDAICICVPTPLTKTKEPDLSYVTYESEEISKQLQPGQLVVLESTTYPGTTSEDNADLVYLTSTSPDHRTHSWDIVLDNGVPHLLSCDRDEPTTSCSVLHHYWTNGWQTETVCNTAQFGTYVYTAGAVFADCDATTIYACVPVDNAIELQKWEYTTLWEKTEDITRASGGEGHDHFRPMAVRNGSGSFLLMWCYTEKYTFYMGPDA